MDGLLNSADSHRLLIEILEKLKSNELRWIYEQMDSDRNSDSFQKEYLLLSTSFAAQRRERPDYCCTFDETCRSIIARQSGNAIPENSVKQKDYLEALGFKHRPQLDRILKGTSPMNISNLLALCHGFRREAQQLFWLNHFLSFFPQTLFIGEGASGFDLAATVNETEYQKEETGITGSPAFRSLSFVVAKISSARLRQIADSLPEKEQLLLSGFLNKANYVEMTSLFGPQPYRLYTVIDQLRKARKKTRTQLINELGITSNTWDRWKNNWKKAEAENFRYLPKPSLRRRHLLILTLVFQLDYLQTIAFLQIGGYRLGSNADDSKIIDYLLNNAGDAEALKVMLYNSRY